MVSTIKKASVAFMVAAFATIMLGGYTAANTHVVYACGHHCGGCGFSCGGCGFTVAAVAVAVAVAVVAVAAVVK